MSLINIFQVAFKSLLKNKTRTLLTMLGIIIGVAAVITMLAIGEGAKSVVEEQIATMGTNVITVMSNFSHRSNVRGEAGSGSAIRLEDIDEIAEQVDGINYISPVIGVFGQLRYRSFNWRTSGSGVDTDFFFIRNHDVEYGEFFSSNDVRTAAKVVVLGKTVADNLFPDTDPIGQTIRIRNVPMIVVGVLRAKGQSAISGDLDNIYLIPYTTALQR